MRKCSVPGCGRKHLAKGFCNTHYTRVKKHPLSPNLTPLLLPWPKKCSVLGCNRKYCNKGFCRTHLKRHHAKLPLDLPIFRPNERIGPLNSNWKGGISEYQNHSKMKRMRNIVLEEENYTCHYCGKPTNKIHHKDLSKDNHKRENLTACCNSCNLKFPRSRKSKYIKLYGRTLAEISKLLSISIPTVWKLHKVGKLPNILAKKALALSSPI
jgi:5-methylcytosine-specific restriction endonuclease McrA